MCCIPSDQRDRQTDPIDSLYLSLLVQGYCHTVAWICVHLYIQLMLGILRVSTWWGYTKSEKTMRYLKYAGLQWSRDSRINILQKKSKHMKSVHIYIASAAREANWQLYLHVCSLGEHNQLGSCRSLAGFPTHTLSTPFTQKRRRKKE